MHTGRAFAIRETFHLYQFSDNLLQNFCLGSTINIINWEILDKTIQQKLLITKHGIFLKQIN